MTTTNGTAKAARPLTILLFEDNPVDAELLREALEQEPIGPYVLEEAHLVSAGIKRLSKGEVDVVLLDLVLPDSKGMETLVTVRGEAPWVPIVVLTSSDDEELALQALQKGAQDYLAKGFIQVYRNLLGRAIRYAIERHRLIAELKRAEEKEKQLAAEEKRRAEELDTACRNLKQTQAMLVQAEKMSAIGQLASGIAHEVKNPLSVILQGINYFEREMSLTSGEQREVSQMMREAVTRSDRIIRGLLDFSKPALLELRPQPLAPIVESSVALVEKQLAVKNIRVELDLPPTLPMGMMDENQMKQVFINLILNAFHAMPDGGCLTIRGSTTTLTQLRDRVGRRATDFFWPGNIALLCEIEDTGTGMPEQHLAKVFDPFFTTKPPGQGTGLGLAITRAIVENHRGFITIESQEGLGTVVRVVLPVAIEG